MKRRRRICCPVGASAWPISVHSWTNAHCCAVKVSAGHCNRRECTTPALELLTPQPSSVGLGGELFLQLLARHPDVDAIFFGNDDLAQGALLEALRHGIKVPERVAVLGFNDLPASSFMVPRLSSISTPREAIGRRAAEHLLAIMAGNKIAKPVVDMGFELQVREST